MAHGDEARGAHSHNSEGIVASLAKSVGHEDAVRITSKDVVIWKDARIAEGRALKTIADSDLACIKSLFRYGIANHLLTANPADGVRVKVYAAAVKCQLIANPRFTNVVLHDCWTIHRSRPTGAQHKIILNSKIILVICESSIYSDVY
ncbi:hypothetical protein ACRAWG_21845 [Methylobacterium sp. P31]